MYQKLGHHTFYPPGFFFWEDPMVTFHKAPTLKLHFFTWSSVSLVVKEICWSWNQNQQNSGIVSYTYSIKQVHMCMCVCVLAPGTCAFVCASIQTCAHQNIHLQIGMWTLAQANKSLPIMLVEFSRRQTKQNPMSQCHPFRHSSKATSTHQTLRLPLLVRCNCAAWLDWRLFG